MKAPRRTSSQDVPIRRHFEEIDRNRRAWERKPILREIYSGFYDRILALVDDAAPGRVVEIGSGLGALKQRRPDAIASDLFPNPWLDLACDAYRLPFHAGCVSHLILFDVFHHLEQPRRFLDEAARVLTPSGRVIVFEPYISLLSVTAYGLFHHEPLGWFREIDQGSAGPPPKRYYAAQGNSTRLFFGNKERAWLQGWTIFHAEAFSSLSYLLSGGFSRPCLYPASWRGRIEGLDRALSRFPRLAGARCVVGLRRVV